MGKKHKHYGEAAEGLLFEDVGAPYIIYSWEYPDRTWAGVVYSHDESKFVDSKHCSKKQYKKWLENQKKEYGILVDQKTMKLSDFVGKRVVRGDAVLQSWPFRLQEARELTGKRHVQSLEQYLSIKQAGDKSATAQDMRPRLLLMAILLSGACLQSVLDSDEISRPQERRIAPILQVATEKNRDIGDFLIKAAKSFCVKTAEDESPLSFQNPPYFPYTGSKASELENAYIEAEGGGKKKFRLPTLYRNCSMVLNARVLTPSIAQAFIRRNPQCSVVVGGNVDLKVDGIFELTAAELSPEQMDWGQPDLQELSCEFSMWMFGRYRRKHKWAKALAIEASRMLDVYGEEHKQIKQADRYHWIVLLTTVMALNEFLTAEEGWSESFGKYQRGVWLNVLLPGCCVVSQEDVPMEDRGIVVEADYPEIFRQTLTEMLADTARFPFVPRTKEKEICPYHAEEDTSFEFYGYRRWRIKGNKPHEPAIYFDRKQFLKLFAQFAPRPCEASDVLEYCEVSKKQEWFPRRSKSIRKDRIPRTPDDESTPQSVLLRLEQLDFLQADKLKELLQPFQDN